MNIVYILTRSDTVGGVQNHVVELAAAMIAEGHVATVLCGGEGQYFEKLERYGVPYLPVAGLSNSISLRNDWEAFRGVTLALKKIDPDIVSTHSTKSGLIGRLASRKLDIPVIFTAHGWAFTHGVGGLKQILYSALERWLARKTDHIICVSEFDKQIAIRAGISSTILSTVHNGRMDEFDESLSGTTNLVPVILMIGRLDAQKDHITLFKALAILNARCNFRVVLLGDGPKLNEYRDTVLQLGLVDKVEFKGLVKQVHRELRQADIFALITNYEGFPRSTLEAMCASLPVVVSNAGGSAEAVEQNVSGFVVEKQAVDDIAFVLEDLLTNREKRTAMGARGRELFIERFTFTKMFDETKKIYAQVLVR